MKRWIAMTKDNQKINEDSEKWNDVKDNIQRLCFDNNGQIISLPPNLQYFQAKTASADIGSSNVQIESRYIGFHLGNTLVRVRINEKNNNISIELENDG